MPSDAKIIRLEPEEQNLSEVTVMASLPVYKMENGGIATDVQNSRLKNSGTATDVLAQLPFVTQNKDYFTVFGKGAPAIYINNRLVRDIAELQEINSADINKVTVITNPGVEYDATVQAVIKIETLRKQGDGFSGTLMNNIIVDRKFSHNEMADINYRINLKYGAEYSYTKYAQFFYVNDAGLSDELTSICRERIFLTQEKQNAFPKSTILVHTF